MLDVDGLSLHITRKPIKNLYLRIKPPTGRIEVSAPRRMSDQRIAQFARERHEWIVRQQQRMAVEYEQSLRELGVARNRNSAGVTDADGTAGMVDFSHEAGARDAAGAADAIDAQWSAAGVASSIDALGRVANKGAAGIAVVTDATSEGDATLQTDAATPIDTAQPSHDINPSNTADTTTLVDHPVPPSGDMHAAIWTDARKHQAAAAINALLPQLLAKWAPIIGRSPSHITLRVMTSRWGSCTPKTGRIRLNLQLGLMEPQFLEYVLVHEMTHLWANGHGPEFQRRMSLYLPQWRRLRRELNRRIVW